MGVWACGVVLPGVWGRDGALVGMLTGARTWPGVLVGMWAGGGTLDGVRM
ncbi:hypothetical protein [Nonomuraea jabiensis]